MGWKPADLPSLAEAARPGLGEIDLAKYASRRGPFDGRSRSARSPRRGSTGPEPRGVARETGVGACIATAVSSR